MLENLCIVIMHDHSIVCMSAIRKEKIQINGGLFSVKKFSLEIENQMCFFLNFERTMGLK